MHGKAKEQAEIDGEKEIIETSTIQAMGKNKYGDVIQKELEEKLNINAGDDQTEVINNGDTLVVKFVDSGRYYEVDSDGNVSEPLEIIADEYAGDITKGGRCDGSETEPYEINCIEDLVVFSIITNGGNSDLEISSSNFKEKYVVLNRTLDFNSIFSYNDYTTTKYGDLNTDGIIENIRAELTKTDDNCIGFTPIGKNKTYCFQGNFDGQQNTLKNIYVNVEQGAGVFGCIYYATIKNLSVTGNIKSKEYHAGGIVGETASYVDNIIIDCCNNSEVVSNDNCAGGIIGNTSYSRARIINCYNKGKIIGNKAGGIIGRAHGFNGNVNVINCYNQGIVESISIGGGIIGETQEGAQSPISMYNVFSIGLLIGDNNGGIAGSWTKEELYNCFYLDSIADYGIKSNPTYTSGIEKLNLTYMKSKEFIDTLNEYVNEYNSNNKDNEDFCELNLWKSGENGYPTFE